VSRSLRREALNLPNAITLTRIAAIPVFLWFTFFESREDSFIAAVLFAVTGATDFLDGWVARRKNLVTVIGKFLDPLADKLIVMAALVMLVHLGRVAAWVVIAIMAREFIVTGLRTIAMSEGIVIAAGQEGKQKTAFQVAAITFLLLHYTYPVDALVFSFELDANRVGTWLLYISLFFSVWSAVSYFVGFIRAVYARPDAPGAGAGGAADGRADGGRGESAGSRGNDVRASVGKALDTPRGRPL
jgi:CDP-diacylglycerol---glycerol-3-phosphate 3-phosphatidyltransferase